MGESMSSQVAVASILAETAPRSLFSVGPCSFELGVIIKTNERTFTAPCGLNRKMFKTRITTFERILRILL